MKNNDITSKAKWIWTSEWDLADNDRIAGFVYFRKTFYLPNNKFTSTINVTADSRYRLFINGISVGFGPCKGDRNTWYYDTLDISSYLKPGINVLSAQVLRYGASRSGNASVWRSPKPGFYVDGGIKDESGDHFIDLSTNDSWRCHKDGAIEIDQGVYTAFLGITETVLGTRIPWGWNSIIFNEDNWMKAVEYEIDTRMGNLSYWRLDKRSIPMMKETNRNFIGIKKLTDPKNSRQCWQDMITNGNELTIPPLSKVVIELDAGELTTGFIRFSMSQGSEASIKLLCAESYENKPYYIPYHRDKNIRDDCENGLLYGDIDTYYVAGVKREEGFGQEFYEPFWFRTFRYVRVEIETKEQPLVLNSLNYREYGYPLEVIGTFESSNTGYDKFWDISIRTLRRCMHESYEDCPYYEQLQYAMDTRSQILFTYNISGDDRLARKTIYDFHSSLLPQGLTQSRYPSYNEQVIPIFSLYWIFMIHDHMMYFGDKKLVRRYISTVDSVLEFFNRMLDERGLVGSMPEEYWSYIDWAEEWRNTFGSPTASLYGPITMHSLAYIVTLNYSAELASFIGRDGLALEYKSRAREIKASVLKYCTSSNKNLFTDGPGIEEFSQHTQVWAVLSETIMGESAHTLISDMLKESSIPVCSFAMSFYLFRALAKVNLYEKVDDLWKPWTKMVDQQLTTWMEDTVSQRSDCHGWGALPLYEFGSEILGIQPLAPGYSKIKVQPRLGNLKWAKGQVITSKGIVRVECIRKGNVLDITIEGPKDIPLELHLSDGSIQMYDSSLSITKQIIVN